MASSNKKTRIANLWGIPDSVIDTKLSQLKTTIIDISDDTLLEYLLKWDLDIEKAINYHFNQLNESKQSLEPDINKQSKIDKIPPLIINDTIDTMEVLNDHDININHRKNRKRKRSQIDDDNDNNQETEDRSIKRAKLSSSKREIICIDDDDDDDDEEDDDLNHNEINDDKELYSKFKRLLFINKIQIGTDTKCPLYPYFVDTQNKLESNTSFKTSEFMKLSFNDKNDNDSNENEIWSLNKNNILSNDESFDKLIEKVDKYREVLTLDEIEWITINQKQRDKIGKIIKFMSENLKDLSLFCVSFDDYGDNWFAIGITSNSNLIGFSFAVYV